MSAARYHSDFPPQNLNWDRLTPLIGKTHAIIGRYGAMLEVIRNEEILLSPLTTKEAECSSRIEGTQATMVEVLQFEAQGDDKELTENKKGDIKEIINYRDAMVNAVKDLEKLPLCNRVMLQAHKKLMRGVRGRDKAPGRYRKIPNWIGPAGCTMDQAYYVPPAADEIPKLMDRWEKYIHEETRDTLVQLALIHAEFEAIHPFLDGNGRLGRMLIPMYLFQKKLIHTPSFYISAYLEANRDKYYESLRGVSRDHNWTGWCEFFLEALHDQAQNNLGKVTQIWDLYNSLKADLPRLTHSQFAITILDGIFKVPIFQLSTFVEDLKIPEPSARRLIKIMEKAHILETYIKPMGRRSGLMVFPKLLNIADEEVEF